MRTVNVRGVVFGSGLPKICIPLVARDAAQLDAALALAAKSEYDLVEFRADHYAEDERQALVMIRERIGDKPLLYTLRTAEEGGAASPDDKEYTARILSAAPLADLVDVQQGRLKSPELLDTVRERGARVIGSFHDFSGTPCADEIVRILTRMQEQGFDMTKTAVMPRTRRDVLELMEASVRMAEELADRPFITLSMGALGMVSRSSGTLTGSCLTFGTAGEASAPGQPDAKCLKAALDLLAGPAGDQD